MEIEHSLEVRVWGAIIRALEAEGFSKNEAYDLAKRGAQLLTDPNASTTAPGCPPDSLSRAAMPSTSSSALNALPDELSRKIDWQTERLSARLLHLSTVLGIIAVTIFGGFLVLAMVLYVALNR